MTTLKFIGIPIQPFKVGVTDIVLEVVPPDTLAGAFQLGILPVPNKPNPIELVEFAHV
jgi:hypothetical protein